MEAGRPFAGASAVAIMNSGTSPPSEWPWEVYAELPYREPPTQDGPRRSAAFRLLDTSRITVDWQPRWGWVDIRVPSLGADFGWRLQAILRSELLCAWQRVVLPVQQEPQDLFEWAVHHAKALGFFPAGVVSRYFGEHTDGFFLQRPSPRGGVDRIETADLKLHPTTEYLRLSEIVQAASQQGFIAV